jgi:hypothetical protein
MSTNPKRCWFRFSLRTLFVLVTAFGFVVAWLGWQLQIVRHRQAVRRQVEETDGIVFAGDIEWKRSPAIVVMRDADYTYKISPLRRFLGDQFIELIGFNRQLTADDHRAIDSIPEAEVDGIP